MYSFCYKTEYVRFQSLPGLMHAWFTMEVYNHLKKCAESFGHRYLMCLDSVLILHCSEDHRMTEWDAPHLDPPASPLVHY